MKLEIIFNNETPPVNYMNNIASSPESKFEPIEVKVASGGKGTRQESLLTFFQQMTYAFCCVNNLAGDKINNLKVSDIWFLKDINKSNSTSFGSGTVKDEETKYDIVIYDITDGVITEHMYLTRNQVESKVTKHNNKSPLVFLNGVPIDNLQGNKINEDILLKQVGQNSAANILGMVAITEKYFKGYHLKWNMFTQKLTLTDDKGSLISYDGIREADIYSAIKLFTLLLEKGPHIGVFYINVLNITSPVLQGLLALIQMVYQNKCLVFLYNCQYLKDTTVERQLLELPNYYIGGKK